MKNTTSQYLKLLLVLLLLSSTAVNAQDDRLIGEWIPSNIPLTPPANVTLVITKSGERYIASPSQSFVIAPPNNCPVLTSTAMLTLTPLSTTKYQANFVMLTPPSCTSIPLDSRDLEIAFSPDNKKFIACDKTAICSGWERVGQAPELINLKTVPSVPTALSSKGAITLTWLPLIGASSYRVTLRGPITVIKSIKKGTSTKFSKLPKGTYKATLNGLFKDDLNSISATKPSKALKVVVK